MQRKLASFKHILFPGTGCDNFNAFNIIKYIKTIIPDMFRCYKHLFANKKLYEAAINSSLSLDSYPRILLRI